MWMLTVLLACSGSKDESAESVPPPSLTWLSPAEGDTLAAGDVTASVVIDNFSLREPAKHNSGAAAGYVRITVDGAEVLLTGQTSFTLTLASGNHTLGGQLFYEDGDEVMASAEALCEEDATDGCSPVESEISVTVQ